MPEVYVYIKGNQAALVAVMAALSAEFGIVSHSRVEATDDGWHDAALYVAVPSENEPAAYDAPLIEE